MSVTAEVLERALELLREEGWIQNNSGRKGEGFCSGGAINAAVREILAEQYGSDKAHIESQARAALLKIIHKPYTHRSVAYWNDKSTRTFNEVEQAFKEAINQELAGGGGKK